MREFMTSKEVADYCGVTPSGVMRWMKQGLKSAGKKSMRGGKGYLFDREEVDSFMKSKQNGTAVSIVVDEDKVEQVEKDVWSVPSVIDPKLRIKFLVWCVMGPDLKFLK